MLPEIPAKRYFTIGEVAELCDVKPHVLRYWEQEFAQLRPIKRRGNRRYYQHHEVLMIRRIRDLLYREGFTINGARSRLQESAQQRDRGVAHNSGARLDPAEASTRPPPAAAPLDLAALRRELLQIRELLREESAQDSSSPGSAAPTESDAPAPD